jgi:hypothetical protein
MDKNSTAKKRSVSLYPADEKIVLQFARPRGLGFSTALRLIVREWAEVVQTEKSAEASAQ